MSHGTVLVVEDEILIRLVLADVLTDEGYFVVEAGNVLEAIAAIGRYPPFHALITDIDMPGALNGIDLATMVSCIAPATKIVVTSGGHLADRIPASFCFLAKPFCIDRILSFLRSDVCTGSQNWRTRTH